MYVYRCTYNPVKTDRQEQENRQAIHTEHLEVGSQTTSFHHDGRQLLPDPESGPTQGANEPERWCV